PNANLVSGMAWLPKLLQFCHASRLYQNPIARVLLLVDKKFAIALGAKPSPKPDSRWAGARAYKRAAIGRVPPRGEVPIRVNSCRFAPCPPALFDCRSWLARLASNNSS